MSTYKPEGATHYCVKAGLRGSLWYRNTGDGKWWVWWASRGLWALSAHSDRTAELALRPVLVDTGANQ